ncbi:hypothetical protein AXX17_AT3G35170 [Arabidopsis thaliana]|uniref:Uncharacterized protein n=1 Tax=Arabidopsis thaliana TaxID=3702 RepID=A0A178VLC1_ARATH|nr:hypothetical protein AXX17_AT3G35170 [Arabidopsis thaliana]
MPPLRKKTGLKRRRGTTEEPTTKPIDGGTTEEPRTTEEPSSTEKNLGIEGGGVEEPIPTISPVLEAMEEESEEEEKEEEENE